MEKQKETEFNFVEKVFIESFTSADKIAKASEPFCKKIDVQVLATTLFIESMKHIRENKKFKTNMNEQASPEQIAYLQNLGYEGNLKLSKSEATQLISEYKQKDTVY